MSYHTHSQPCSRCTFIALVRSAPSTIVANQNNLKFVLVWQAEGTDRGAALTTANHSKWLVSSKQTPTKEKTRISRHLYLTFFVLLLFQRQISPHCLDLFLSSHVSIKTLRRSLISTVACARKCTTCGYVSAQKYYWMDWMVSFPQYVLSLERKGNLNVCILLVDQTLILELWLMFVTEHLLGDPFVTVKHREERKKLSIKVMQIWHDIHLIIHHMGTSQ